MEERRLFIPRSIYLYRPERETVLDIVEIGRYLTSIFPTAKIETRSDYLSHYLRQRGEDQEQWINRLAQGMAEIRVRDLGKKDFFPPPLYGEISYEIEKLRNPAERSVGILYDGFRLQELWRELIPPAESGLFNIHLIFTVQLIGSWDEGDLRYHARTSIYGYPNILSITGLIEAPAKPREYYLLKQQLPPGMRDEVALSRLKEGFKDRILDYDDPRTTEVMKGYVMQAFFNHISGFPFCQQKGCRLYNAHWQEEMLEAQLKGDQEYCPYHQGLIELWRKAAQD